MDAVVARCETLKQAGNEAFATGDVATCIARYNEAIAALTAVEPSARTAAATQLLTTLHSNCANAHLQQEQWSDAAAAASAALAAAEVAGVEHSAVVDKARLRRARATFELQMPFAALVDTLHAESLDSAGEKVRRDAARAVGLTDVDEAFALKRFMGGYTAIATQPIRSGTRIFNEAQLITAVHNDDDATGDGSAATSTESLVAHFTKELLVLRRSSDTAQRALYARTLREMAGSWPRTLDDIPTTVRDATVEQIDQQLNDEERADASTRDELLLIALQCRYNRFHSGFFRTCALINHACDANAAMKYMPGRSPSFHSDVDPTKISGFDSIGIVGLVACRDIRRDEVISVKYLNDFDFLLGVAARRELLYGSWLFECTCPRCVADDQPDVTCEMVRCTTAGCGGFAHLPLWTLDDSPVARKAMGIKRPCSVCGAEQSLGEDRAKLLSDVRLQALRVQAEFAQMPIFSLSDLHARIATLRQTVAEHCHGDHWLHRVLLYVFCILAQRRVDECVEFFATGKIAVEAAAQQLGLDTFRWEVDPRTRRYVPHFADTIDVLGWLVELHARICDFYPDNQLWALHMSVCRAAALLAIARPDDMLPAAEALLAPRVRQLDRSHCVAMHGLLQQSGRLSAKQLKPFSKLLK